MNCWLLHCCMFIYCICTQYLVGAPFALITASIRRGMEVISLWHCWGGMEAQVSLTLAISSFAFLVSCFSFSSWQYTIDSLASQAHQQHGHLTNFRCFWQCGQVPNPAGKWNQHLLKAGQQKEAWSALKLFGKRVQWRCFSKNTMDKHQQMTLHPKSSQTVET